MAAAAPPVVGGLPTVLDASSSDDQTSITWHDPLYPYVLNRYTVMHYFEFSPFFDRTSNNMIARRQNLDPAVPGVLESLPPGLEYVLEVEQPPHLFVVRKQLRKDGAPPVTLAHYYVLDKMVYQSPTLHAALSTRVRRCVWALQEGFQRLKHDLDPLTRLAKEEAARQAKEHQSALAAAQHPGHTQQPQHPDQAGQHPEQAPHAAAEPGPGSTDAATAAANGGLEEDEFGARSGYSAAAERRWRKAANIIDSVLSHHPLPDMPPEYYAAAKPEAPSAPAPAPAPAPTAAPGAPAAANGDVADGLAQ